MSRLPQYLFNRLEKLFREYEASSSSSKHRRALRLLIATDYNVFSMNLCLACGLSLSLSLPLSLSLCRCLAFVWYLPISDPVFLMSFTSGVFFPPSQVLSVGDFHVQAQQLPVRGVHGAQVGGVKLSSHRVSCGALLFCCCGGCLGVCQQF